MSYNPDTLGPLPPCAPSFSPRWPGDVGGYTADQMRAYALQERAAERKLLEADAKRYRFLREITEEGDTILTTQSGTELDASVDSVMADRATNVAGNALRLG